MELKKKTIAWAGRNSNALSKKSPWTRQINYYLFPTGPKNSHWLRMRACSNLTSPLAATRIVSANATKTSASSVSAALALSLTWLFRVQRRKMIPTALRKMTLALIGTYGDVDSRAAGAAVVRIGTSVRIGHVRLNVTLWGPPCSAGTRNWM